MKPITWWRYYISFLFPVKIITTFSETNVPIDIQFYAGQYQMIVGEAIYSFGLKYAPYTKAFKKIGKNKIAQKEDVLILGAGLGSCVKILELLYPNPDRVYELVDIDEVILSLCEQFVCEEFPSINAYFYHADAFDFLETLEHTYDLICVDLFIELMIPKAILKSPFLEQCKKLIKKDGFIVFNTYIRSKVDKIGFEENLRKQFNAVKSFTYRLNTIYIVSN